MTVKIGFTRIWYRCKWCAFPLKENGEKINQSAHSEIEVAKVLVKDEDEKNRLFAAGNDFNFVTNVDDIFIRSRHYDRSGIDGAYRTC